MPWLGNACEICAEPVLFQQIRCPRCRLAPPFFQQVLTPYRYAFPIDRLILQFKHHNHWPSGRLLAGLLAEHLEHETHEGQQLAELLIPVPISASRLRQRGFNQTDWLADWLGKSLQRPVEKSVLQRTKQGAAQQTLDAAARRANLQNVFQLAQADSVQGRHVALIDDVLTTGSTSDILARLLLNAGARRVDVYCVARTPPPNQEDFQHETLPL